MISATVVELSHWQFALTSAFHLVFMPLNLSLSLLLSMTETRNLLSRNSGYKLICEFWTRIFAINFSLGLLARLGMLFQYGTQDSYFSDYAGEVLFLPIGIELLGSFWLAALLFGPYVYGRQAMGKIPHLLISWLLCLALLLGAGWQLLAQSWLENPQAAVFNYQSFRLELNDFKHILENSATVWQVLNDLSLAYLIGAGTILAISSWRWYHHASPEIDRYSYRFAALLGLLAVSSLLTSTLIHHPLTPLASQSVALLTDADRTALTAKTEAKIHNSIYAYRLLLELRDENQSAQLLENFQQNQADLGYVWLLKPWTDHLAEASDQQVKQAAQASLPDKTELMNWLQLFALLCTALSLLGFLLATGFSHRRIPPLWLLKSAYYLGALPWLAALCSWLATQINLQHWGVFAQLPSFLGVSSLATTDLWFNLGLDSMIGLTLLAIAVFLLRPAVMQNLVPLWPESKDEL
ncbi:cytochrome ubiquinol oxidase subunit I [Methylomonas paludis]|uniref:Cytochrome ubiquinol oxidase subunit I n=1 Tax=Methylomonas paludis TaxID=1173101 RepID=A0A975MPW4_9GAMM|nr:cytochrome ubiquinol oxidase subunit I [Methylomonas paludis]QWF71289.1 cytochrome ubiquinol oxidase subunit I [Methylomonas paludis]